MKLRTKVIVFYAGSTLLITAALGGFLYHRLWEDRIGAIREDIAKQLQHVDFTLGLFLAELENDLNHLAANPVVRSRDDGQFTSFLGADERAFRYDIRPLEQSIIDRFRSYETTHPYVNVVYMGRENGSFVRSRRRERPTTYDPRERPWYLLAKANPGRVVITDVYRSLTTPDINIGVVRALVDRKGRFYGVVGVDVTLARLTDFIANMKISPAGQIFLTDSKGSILVSEDRNMHFKSIRDYSPGLHRLLTENRQGYASLEIRGQKSHIHYRTAAVEGWKMAVVIPAEKIEGQIRGPVAMTVFGLSAGFLLVTVLTLIGLNILVVGPLHRLAGETRYIAETSNLDRRIEVRSGDEIGLLAGSFNEMIGALAKTQASLVTTGEELRSHRDHLEEMVKERTAMLQEVNEDLSREIDDRIRREAELQRTMGELAVAKKQAEAADNLKSAFLATMSHELRTPLNSIIGFTGIILRERVGPLNDEQKKQLNMVRRSSQHLLALINDVLDISKIEAGQLQVFPEKIDLRQIVDKVVQAERPLADGRGLELAYEIAPGAETAAGDQRRVEQVLLNLLSNALKFTERGSVRIACEAEADTVVVKVIDTGIGIKEEDLDKLFQSFRQIDSGLTRKYDGTGLGLSISKRLVELMGGRIRVESVWGAGSTFAFSLPKEGATG
ncbi:MAG: sensor histidine kinase [Syntrophales bacterium]